MNQEKYLENLLQKLLNGNRITIDSKGEWISHVQKAPGVYIIRNGETVLYVGETGNLQKRMKDMLKTYNHSFRRILGEKLFYNDPNYSVASSRKKYHENIERKIDAWLSVNCDVSFITTSLGRKELEELIQEKFAEELLNIRSRRK